MKDNCCRERQLWLICYYWLARKRCFIYSMKTNLLRKIPPLITSYGFERVRALLISSPSRVSNTDWIQHISCYLRVITWVLQLQNPFNGRHLLIFINYKLFFCLTTTAKLHRPENVIIITTSLTVSHMDHELISYSFKCMFLLTIPFPHKHVIHSII